MFREVRGKSQQDMEKRVEETKKTNIENVTHNAAANDVRREPSPLSFEQKRRRDGVRITVWDTVQKCTP